MPPLKIAFFSPLPPSRSGIADYSEALLAALRNLADVDVFDKRETDKREASSFDPAAFDAAAFDVAIYQVGNNAYHDFVYETALRHPGITVMHEANLHHLICDLTIKRNDWDGYTAECEYNGGPAALQFAQRVRALEVGPDYEGLAMTKRLLEASRGVVVHSDFMVRQVRQQGYAGPVAMIPHGAWIPQTDRQSVRYTLGVDESTPLIGAFGYLKPYKRIAESLRALRRLVRLEPRVKMILVGEPHPDFPVEELIRTLDLQEHVRLLGFVPIGQFVDYMSACDIILNLRYPTVGETSGSLLRALGLGRAVLVSDVGAFAELPDDICLKVPTGPQATAGSEEDLIFEYLNVLVSRPDLAQAMGSRAKQWVERECNWKAVAERYVAFVRQLQTRRLDGAEEQHSGEEDVRDVLDEGSAIGPETPVSERPKIDGDYIRSWTAPDARDYAEQHKTRLIHTLEITPAGDESKSVLEMGSYMQITPALKYKLRYGNVRGCYYGKLGVLDRKSIQSETGESFTCDVDHFDAEKDVYPYQDETFDTVLCCELLEHLFNDPMFMMSEINRILKPGGHLVLTTPNVGSLRGLAAVLQGYHPGFFPAYIYPRPQSEESHPRHNREYMPMEIQHLFTNAGFDTVRLETGEFADQPHPEFGWVTHLLDRYQLPKDLRGDGIYAVGSKAAAPRERYPAWLYS